MSDILKEVTEVGGQIFKTINLVVTVFSIIFALLNCFFGFQLKKFWISLIGFAIGFFLGLIPCLLWIESDSVVGIAVAVGLVVGILLALLAFRLYKVGIFIWVAFMTFASVAGLFQGNDEWIGIALGIAAGILIGILALRFLRPVCIISTAINGGILATQNLLPLCNINGTGIILAAGIGLSALGMLVQFCLTKGKG